MLRPIELTIPLQRSTETNRLQTGDRAPEIQQSQFADKFNQEMLLKEKQVQQMQDAERQRVERDGRGNGGAAGGQQKKKKAKPDDGPTKKKAPLPGESMFDVRV